MAKTGIQYESIGPSRGGADGAVVPEMRSDWEAAGQTFQPGAPLIDDGNGYLKEAGRAVLSVTVTAGGGSYTSAPTVVFTPQGSVISGTITAGGSGYKVAPTVSFSGGAGSGAAATAVIGGGVVQSIIITNPGSGYTSAPTIAFAAVGSDPGTGAAATAVMTGLVVTAATATATVASNAVTVVTVTSGGSGYTQTPLVTFTGGGGSAAAATASIKITKLWGFSVDPGRNSAVDGANRTLYHDVESARQEFTGTYQTTSLASKTDRYKTAGLVRDPLTGKWYVDSTDTGAQLQLRGFEGEWVDGDSYPTVNFTVISSFIKGT